MSTPMKPAGILRDNMWTNNPVFMQILGICSALAVTNRMVNTMIMTLGVMFTTGLSSLTISTIKTLIPRRVRMIVQVLVIAFYVIIVDITIRAFLPEISRQLGPYVGLIITNCIIMGRAEAFAAANKPLLSFWDGITSGAGYMFVLLLISVVREILGFGTFAGIQILPDSFPLWTIMVMPPSAFFMLAIVIWVVKSIMIKKGGLPT